MKKRPKSRHTKNFARRMLRCGPDGIFKLARKNEHDRVEFFYVYQRFMALKWMQRGHYIFYKTIEIGNAKGVLILYFLRKDVITPTEYLDNKTLWLTVRGPRHAKEFCL